MFAKTSDSVNPSLSPRSKTISLGLNPVNAPPLRFRPLVKAADFPFLDQTEKNVYQQKYQGDNNYGYENEYQQDSNSNYEQDYPPSPDQLRGQYTEFQKQLIAEQQSGNYDHGSNSTDRAKTLAQGLQYQGHLSPSGADKEKLRAKYAEYQKKQVAEESHLIEPTRQKFVRKNVDEDFGPGLVIGKQTDKETEYRSKREAQAAYQRQLSNDIRSKPIAGDRKIVERRAHSPEPTQSNFMSRIGDRTDGSGETEADRRRREAQRILSTNREDVLQRLHEASSPENRKFREDRAHGRVEEAVKFEDAPYRFIGGSPEAAKGRKKAMQEQYLAQLLQDNGPPSQGRPVHQQPDPMAEYVNRSGWTGLNIGGHSMDEAHQGASKNEKFMKQAAYKRLLDQQRMQADDLARMDQMKYGKY